MDDATKMDDSMRVGKTISLKKLTVMSVVVYATILLTITRNVINIEASTSDKLRTMFSWRNGCEEESPWMW
jgi:hypothetical protein